MQREAEGGQQEDHPSPDRQQTRVVEGAGGQVRPRGLLQEELQGHRREGGHQSLKL